MTGRISKALSRRRFLEYLSASPLLLPEAKAQLSSETETRIQSPDEALNVFDFMPVARKNISAAHWAYLMTGSDDNLTVEANRQGFQLFQIRPRRFTDIANIDTTVELLGQRYPSPLMLAPISSQQAFHREGELASARAARARGAQMILSTLTSCPLQDVAKEHQRPLWFQLYPTDDWEVTRQLLERAERANCPVLMLTADNPARSNREMQNRAGNKTQPQCGTCHQPGMQAFLREHAMFEGMDFSRVRSHLDPITWPLVDRIRRVSGMKVVIKGVVTAEDAELCVRHGVDGIVVSNHGGRQEESLLSTIEVLPEVVQAVNGKMPVLIDSGFRRGTDVFKALALGAAAVCIGRPYIWGLGAFGQAGVERVLELMHAELVLIMKMSGTTAISRITPDFVRRRPR